MEGSDPDVRMTVTRVKCECGEWRFFVSDWIGQVTETCYGCGFRQALRGNPPIPEKTTVQRGDGVMVELEVCAWPEGCTQRVESARTDYCTDHCHARKNIRLREKRARQRDTFILRAQGIALRNSHGGR